MADTNLDDPCERYKMLNAAYYRLISGQQESEVTYMANGVTRTVRYSQANLSNLIGELRDAEGECAAKNGLARPRRRYSIQGGSRGF